MPETWTFGRKLGAGFALMLALTMLVGAVAAYSLRQVVAAKDEVINGSAQSLVNAEQLHAAVERKGGAARGFLLTGDAKFRDGVTDARSEFSAALSNLRARAESAEVLAMIDRIERAEQTNQDTVEEAFTARAAGAPIDQIVAKFERDVVPTREALDKEMVSFVTTVQDALAAGERSAAAYADSAFSLIVLIVFAAVIAACVFGWLLTRSITAQIGTAVHRIRSSSAELQSAATQQASGSREQATAMNEIATTINELLATSNQITESAQRVATIASETGDAAGLGDATVQRAQESISVIRRQVDAIVGHMLELGRKSQQVGAVLDIINELSEQTNILAINATIEAAGAGESGRRFAVVADEIRKLADRVAGSTKEIRALIDDVRAAVNTTIMATESGSKAVDGGARQFSEVASSFQHIAGLVDTTTQAAREIELSTKQQSTAVEQVNIAISNVAQATRETEASADQTLQTAAELSGLSGDLTRIVQPGAAA